MDVPDQGVTMSDEIRVPHVAEPRQGKVARLKVSTRESESDRAMLTVRLALPRKYMTVEGHLFGDEQHTTVISQFQMGLN
jgi:hypothetical protein